MLILGLIVIVILALVMSYMVIQRGPEVHSAPTNPSPPTPPSGVRISRELQEQVRDMALRGNTGQAAKQLHKQTGVPTAQATAIVYALQSGQVFPEPEPASTAPAPEPSHPPRAPVDAELLTTLRRLVTQDRLRRTAAITLLKERTGMNTREARRFLDAL